MLVAGDTLLITASMNYYHPKNATNLTISMQFKYLDIIKIHASSPATAQGPCEFASQGHSNSGDTTYCLPSLGHDQAWVVTWEVLVRDDMPISEAWEESMQWSYWCLGNGDRPKLYRPPAQSLSLQGQLVETRDLNVTTSGYLGFPLTRAQDIANAEIGAGTAVAIGDTIVVDIPVYVPRGHLASLSITVQLAALSISNALAFADNLLMVDTAGVDHTEVGLSSFSTESTQQLAYTSLRRASNLGASGLMRFRTRLAVVDSGTLPTNASAHVITVSVRFGNTAVSQLYEAALTHAMLVLTPSITTSLTIVNQNPAQADAKSRGDAGDVFTVTHSVTVDPTAALYGAVITCTYHGAYDLAGSTVKVEQQLGATVTAITSAAASWQDPTNTAVATMSESALVFAFPSLEPGTRVTIEHVVRLGALTPAHQVLDVVTGVEYSSAPSVGNRSFVQETTANATTLGFSDVTTASAASAQPLATTGTFERTNPGDMVPGENATVDFAVRLPEGFVDDVYATFVLTGSEDDGSLPFVLSGATFLPAPGSNIAIVPATGAMPGGGDDDGDTFGPGGIGSGNSTDGRKMRREVPAGAELTIHARRITNAPDNVNNAKDDLIVRLQVSSQSLGLGGNGKSMVLSGEVVANNTRIRTEGMVFTVVEPILASTIESRKVPVADAEEIMSSKEAALVNFDVDISHTNLSLAPASQVTVQFAFNKTNDIWVHSTLPRTAAPSSKYDLAFASVVATELVTGATNSSAPSRLLVRATIAINESVASNGDVVCGLATVSWQTPAAGATASAPRRFATDSAVCYTHIKPGGSGDVDESLPLGFHVGYSVAIACALVLLIAGIAMRRSSRLRKEQEGQPFGLKGDVHVVSSVAVPSAEDYHDNEWNVVIDMVEDYPAPGGEYGLVGQSVYPADQEPADRDGYGMVGGAVTVDGRPRWGLAYQDPQAEDEYDNIAGLVATRGVGVNDDDDDDYENVGSMLARASEGSRAHGVPSGNGLFAGRASQRANTRGKQSAARTLANIGYDSPSRRTLSGLSEELNIQDFAHGVGGFPFDSSTAGEWPGNFVAHIIRRGIMAVVEEDMQSRFPSAPRLRKNSSASFATDWGDSHLNVRPHIFYLRT